MDHAFLFRKRNPIADHSTAPATGSPLPARVAAGSQLHRLQQTIHRAAELLPLPGPITAFAFLNTLQALESLPFDEGVVAGANLYGCQPFLPEDRYRDLIARRRIRSEDLEAVLRESLGADADLSLGDFGTRFELRLAQLKYFSPRGPAEELRWFVTETDALSQFCAETPWAVRQSFVTETRDWVTHELIGDDSDESLRLFRQRDLLADLTAKFCRVSTLQNPAAANALTLQILWRLCHDGAQQAGPRPLPAAHKVRHRDYLRDVTGEDSDLLVNEVLIRFCSVFTDQGFAAWQLPHREQGFFAAFCQLYATHSGPATQWLRDLPEEIIRLQDSDLGPLESIRESCLILGVEEGEWNTFLPATLMSLRGWAGMLWHMEARPDRVPFPSPAGSLIEFLAVKLILERLALAHLAGRTIGYGGPLSGLRDALVESGTSRIATNYEERAFLIFQLAQRLGWSPPLLARLTPDQWSALVGEIEAFSELDRRRLMHRAFERRLHSRALDALSVYGQRKTARVTNPSFQVVTCVDAREESFRRHIEEICPDAETYGAAGFFGLPIYYRGIADAHFAALCPIVVKPTHWVTEEVVYTLGNTHRRRAKARRALGNASHQFHLESRSFAGGALLTATLGVLATIPLVARVLFPRRTARLRQITSRILQPPEITRLRLERSAVEPGPDEGQVGFTVEEMADFGENMLRDLGLTTGFARLVLFLGHGSFSVNNPHTSVYDCGACTGSAGSPNGRALAAMLNDLRVRQILALRGISIPVSTIFLGGLHNTCDDSVSFLDLDLLPATHFDDFDAVHHVLEEACDRNSHERCRRFDSAPLDLSFPAAHRHVQERSQDLAQARPEFGNATNAICIVGRRQRTRGLYLDRRSFLMSYDPEQDTPDTKILERTLTAIVPVCEGINMQYFLSSIDSTGWGCGTKLPHNVTSLLGVMDGAASDLRPGLPWQGVEIHEPVRLLFVIESTSEALLAIIERNETIGQILKNHWAQLAVLSTESGELKVFRDGTFHVYSALNENLAQAATSTDWYRGVRDHLEFAAIGSPPDAAAGENETEPCLTTSS